MAKATKDKELSVLFFGDVVARPGRGLIREHCMALRDRHKADLVIANGENAAGGTGIEAATAKELVDSGVDVITLGDHAWKWREARSFLESSSSFCIRPANYPAGAPGRGWTVYEWGSYKIGIINLIGRTFITSLVDCPFRVAEHLLSEELKDCDLILCDFHAEATSEKYALGRYLDGKIALLVGTHTHVATADAQILPRGTGYITDLGMCGCTEGVLGMDAGVAVERFMTGLPLAYKAAKGVAALSGIHARINLQSRKTVSISAI